MRKIVTLLFLLLTSTAIAVAQSTNKKMIIHYDYGTGMELLDGKISIPIDNIREVTFEGEDDLTPVYEYKTIRFQFQDNSSPSTRSSVRKAPALESRKYGVFGHYKNDGTTEVQLMRNQKVEYVGGDWTYFPIKYWPRSEQGDIPVSFFAYSPYTESDANDFICVTIESGEPLLKYTSTNPMDDARDLLYGNLLNATGNDNNGYARIQSKHALARFNFKAVADGVSGGGEIELGSSTKITISSIKINGIPQKGSFNLYNQQWTNLSTDTDGFTLEGDNLSEDIRATSSPANQPEGVLSYSKPKPISISPCLFIPTDGANDISFTLEYFVTTEDSNLSEGYVVTKNVITKKVNLNIQAGYSYDVQFVLGLTSVRTEVTISSTWDNTDTNITR